MSELTFTGLNIVFYVILKANSKIALLRGRPVPRKRALISFLRNISGSHSTRIKYLSDQFSNTGILSVTQTLSDIFRYSIKLYNI